MSACNSIKYQTVVGISVIPAAENIHFYLNLIIA